MKSIFSISIFLILFNISGIAQNNVNAYKYVVVPTSFNFLNEPDQYQLNSLTKFLFEKYGFTAFSADETFPQDLNSNRCLALYAEVEKHKAFLTTKLQVHLKDCNNRVVLSSEIGQSREKQYEKVYGLALRDAFDSFEDLDYHYQPEASTTVQVASPTAVKTEVSQQAQSEIDRLRMEVEALKQSQLQKEEAEQQALIAIEKARVQEAQEKAEAETVKATKLVETKKLADSAQDLFINFADSGYTITDAASKPLFDLVFSGKEDVYIVKGQDAIVYKMNTSWMLSTASDSGVSIKILKLK